MLEELTIEFRPELRFVIVDWLFSLNLGIQNRCAQKLLRNFQVFDLLNCLVVVIYIPQKQFDFSTKSFQNIMYLISGKYTFQKSFKNMTNVEIRCQK